MIQNIQGNINSWRDCYPQEIIEFDEETNDITDAEFEFAQVANSYSKPEETEIVFVKKRMVMDEELSFLVLVTLSSILFFIIPSLLFLAVKKDLSEFSKKFLYKTLNFELVIIFFMACIKILPVLGSLIAFGIFIFNFVICVKATNALNSDSEFDYPISLAFIKITQ